jgi:hypothetical protein
MQVSIRDADRRELRTSNIHYLNDHQEFTFGMDLFYEYLRSEHDQGSKERH